ncbi:ImmA/IrrE family metallo-endopeptidase [Leucobacter allii]|uniref:ImmA/IrrE family metallo-endopeptidase n=1 Tax=Leucobacter allii TaxID=2932247 RepID=A0ABY4FLT1_9MICO|nr:ImmA/IrrE family metallo-endopeptidase [Leucobacter allii]UOQ57203.1 ImmA/IrrE family metallo-endopeptidase [Leucobacter allii]
MQRLVTFADSIAVTWEFTFDLDPNRPGNYSDEARHIKILDGMTYIKTICSFAHELGHAVLRHVESIFPHVNERQERAADEWAAHFLIDVEEYKLAEAKYGSRTDWIAQELGVLERLVIAFEGTLDRLGDVVYQGSRMGLGQYVAKFEVA